jgi:hypothetical protein
MNKLIILLMVGLMTNVTIAQEILLSCKWQSGEIKGSRVITKGERSTNDVVLGINIHQKKFTKQIYPGELIFSDWSQNVIIWNTESVPLKVNVDHRLDRISGSLRINFNDLENKITIVSNYTCDKTQKKF